MISVAKKLAAEWYLVIDDEFSKLHRDLTPEEQSLLEADIEQNGCENNLIVWMVDGKRILVDGHHRFGICKTLGIPFGVSERNFSSHIEAKKWANANQRARRNSTEVELKYLRGLEYEEAKKPEGAPKGSKNRAKNKLPQNAVVKSTAEKIADKHGVSPDTVQRDATFARNIDAVASNVGTEFRDAVLSGELKVSATEVAKLAELPKTEQKKAVAGGKPAIKEALASAPRKPPAEKAFDSDLRGDRVMEWGRREISRWPMSARKELEHWFKQLAREALTIPEGEYA